MGEVALKEISGKYTPNPVKPTWFSKKLSKEDIVARLGEPSKEKKKMSDKDFGEIEAIFFPKASAWVCFKDDHLMFIETKLLK